MFNTNKNHLPSSMSESLSDNSLSEEEDDEAQTVFLSALFFTSLFNTTPAEKCVLKCLTGRICTHWNKKMALNTSEIFVICSLYEQRGN